MNIFSPSMHSGAAAQAVDINMSGVMQFAGYWQNASINKDAQTKASTFRQRFRTQIDITASEALNGVVFFEIGHTTWGKSGANVGPNTGGALGSDGVSIKVRRTYLDWIIPQTDLKIRMGIQGFITPNMVSGGSQIVEDDMAGITASYTFNPTVSATMWWMRPYADNDSTNGTVNYPSGNYKNNLHTELDLVGLSLPLTFDGAKVTPWGMYASLGRNTFGHYDGTLDDKGKLKVIGAPDYFNTGANYTASMLPRWIAGPQMSYASKDQGSAYWLGLTGEATLWNPFRLAWDMNYASVDMGTASVANLYPKAGKAGKMDLSRSGWLITALAEYKLDFGTPGLVFWYGSGDDDDMKNGSEMMPSIKASPNLTSLGFDGAWGNMSAMALTQNGAGTWGIIARMRDISFVEDLKHTVRVAYYRGTNDKEMTGKFGGPMAQPYAGNGGPGFTYMTEKDAAWEFNLDSTYDIYKNLQLAVELGYIKMDLSEAAWGKKVTNQYGDDMYKIAVGLQYSF